MSRKRTRAVLYTGVGLGYAGDVYMKKPFKNGGQVHVHEADVLGAEGWGSLRKVQELVIGDGCNAVEWVELHPSGKFLYAFCSYWRFGEVRASKLTPGRLVAYAVEPASGALRTPPDASLISGGHQPCQAAISPKRDVLAVAHYLCGTVAIWRVDPERGAVCGATPMRLLRLPLLEGAAPPDEDPVLGTHRGPLAHGVTFSPCGGWLLVCDAGQGALCVWNARQAGALLPGERDVGQLPASQVLRPVRKPGSRPRQCKFGEDGRSVFVAHESTNEVTLHTFDGSSGEVSEAIEECCTLSTRRGGRLQMLAEIVLLPALGVLAVTNRAIGLGTIVAGIAEKRGWSECMVGVVRFFGSCWDGRDPTVALFRADDSLQPLGFLDAGKAEGVGDARHALALPRSLGGGMLCGLTESGKVLHFEAARGRRSLRLAASADVTAPLCLAVLPPG